MSANPRPVALRVSANVIPAELKAIKAWVTWRYEWQKEKWTKEPYQVGGDRHARTNDPSTWGTFSQAAARYQQGAVDGIGFVLTKRWGIIGVDLDHCVESNGSVALWALKIMHEIQSYTEFSPSGNGVRILTKAALPPGRRKKSNIEVYDELRYLTITGHHRAGHPETIEQRQSAIEAFHHRIFAEIKTENPAPVRVLRNLEDNELLERAFRARNGHKVKALYAGDISGYFSQSEAELALCDLLGFYTNDDAQIDRLIRTSGLYREKWNRTGQRTIAKALGNRTCH